MTTAYFSDAGPLWAITSYYNPNRYWRKRANYTQFRRHLALPLVAVELSFSGHYELADADAEILIRCQTGDVMWQKERLLNIALAALPKECELVAWVDCDLILPRPDWTTELQLQLTQFPIVQPFSQAIHLRPDAPLDGADWTSQILFTKSSIASLIVDGISPDTYVSGLSDTKQGTRAPGFIWAARRELIEQCGLYDACITGGGDTALAGAVYGAWEAVSRRQCMNPQQADHFQSWAETIFSAVQGNVGCIEQAALHLWHGEIDHRRYRQRFHDLSPFGFDPAKDIALANGGAWRWASPKPGLHALLHNYFVARNEDGADLHQKAAQAMSPSFGTEPQFLVVRHARWKRHFFDVILNWVSQHFPEHRSLFDVWDLPDETACDAPHLPHLAAWRRLVILAKSLIHRDRAPLRILSNGIPPERDYRLHLPWLQDPVQAWSPATFARSCSLTWQCDDRGIPTINRVDLLANAVKSTAAMLISRAGVRTPRMEAIRDVREFHETQLGMSLPLFVREDCGHRGGMWRADTLDQLRRLPVWRLKRPVAVEVVDVLDPRDGLFRKYRYIAAGDVGISHHVQTSSGWVTRGENRVVTDATQAEELAYIQHLDPRHDELQKARRALGLDIVAFDYGVTQEGRLIIWEANPFPHIKFSQHGLKYRNAALHRTMLAIFRLYLTEAGLAVPQEVEDGLVYPDMSHGRMQRVA